MILVAGLHPAQRLYRTWPRRSVQSHQEPSANVDADIVRIHNGALVEHWDVIQDEKTEEQSISKRPMFGTTFPT